MEVTISCCGKFHAFALAEQMEKHGQLNSLMTCYAYQRNTFLRWFVKRIDKEIIPASKISTNTLLAFPIKLLHGSAYLWLDLYDRWVAGKIKNSQCKIFIGWSGMSLHAIRSAKASGKITILERGSSHIVYQNQILQEEYNKFGIDFSIDKRIIAKELKEYEEADFISIPSKFVWNSFIEKGVDPLKLILNNYGFGHADQPMKLSPFPNKFTILYLGRLNIRKGLFYLFEALDNLVIDKSEFEVHFIGGIDPEIEHLINGYNQENWKFFGHIRFPDLPLYLSKVSVAVQPSVEEGLSLVIPQLLASGIPVIASRNSGGEDLITEGKNGYIVPIRDSIAIGQKLTYLYQNPDFLQEMRKEALTFTLSGKSWDDYGNRYAKFLNALV